MTQAQFASYIRFKTRTNSSTLTDANLLLMANAIKDDMCAEAVDTNEDLFVMRYYRNLVAGQREYAFPSAALTKIKRVEAYFDGENPTYLGEFDTNSVKVPLDGEAAIVAAFANRDPAYDINARALRLYSNSAIDDVTNGLVLHSTQYPANLTSLAGTTDMSIDPSTTEFGVPRPMHKLWADAVVIEWKESRDKPIALTQTEKAWQVRWDKVKSTMKAGNLDRAVVPTSNAEVETGENY